MIDYTLVNRKVDVTILESHVIKKRLKKLRK